jgi:putative oxidoreductase
MGFVALGEALQPLLLLVFRLYWGWQFFTTGQGKLMHHEKVASFFTSLHIPFPGANAWFIGGLECFGGLMLLLGLCSRPFALLLTISMSMAYMAVPEERAKVLNIFHDPSPFLAADPFFFLLTALMVLCFGPGLISVDGLIRHRLRKRAENQRMLREAERAVSAAYSSSRFE